jgi:hypothetical protein
MLIGPFSFSFFRNTYQEYKKEQNVQKNVSTVIYGYIGLVVIWLLLVSIWVWNLVLVCIYWNYLPPFARIIGVLGIISGVFSPISIIVIYLTKQAALIY